MHWFLASDSKLQLPTSEKVKRRGAINCNVVELCWLYAVCSSNDHHQQNDYGKEERSSQLFLKWISIPFWCFLLLGRLKPLIHKLYDLLNYFQHFLLAAHNNPTDHVYSSIWLRLINTLLTTSSLYAIITCIN